MRVVRAEVAEATRKKNAPPLELSDAALPMVTRVWEMAEDLAARGYAQQEARVHRTMAGLEIDLQSCESAHAAAAAENDRLGKELSVSQDRVEELQEKLALAEKQRDEAEAAWSEAQTKLDQLQLELARKSKEEDLLELLTELKEKRMESVAGRA